MRVAVSFSVKYISLFKKKALLWANQFSVCCALNNNQYKNHLYHSHEFLLGAGSVNELKPVTGDNFSELKKFTEQHRDWMFGFLTYDLKNEIEKLQSENSDNLHFPDLHFFIPETLIEIKGDKVTISSLSEEPSTIFSAIEKIEIVKIAKSSASFQPEKKVAKEDYIKNVKAIQQHIIEGDVYELNYCQEFFIENCSIEPIEIFFRLSEISPSPFAAYYKLNDKYLLCASPERFLKKEGDKLISQPIKGTIRRGASATEDEKLKQELQNDLKERAENVMIVDLVRNDLSRSCEAGSVKAEELFGIYTYPQVHQMISTVTGKLSKEIHSTEAIRNAFPMGSMTGAPKIEAMKLIEHYETTKRGLFSGSVGYITPDGSFDFNVVIRSLLYNQAQKYLSFSTGGAITYDSIPEKEYEECLLKAKAIMQVLNNS